MSVEFSNAYQEVLLENLDSILKQNFMFQARLKLLETEANIKTELQAKLDDVTAKYQEALAQVGAAEQYKIQASSNDAIVQEKTRIQSALNDTMRELGTTKGALEGSQVVIEELKSRIAELEKLIPPAPKTPAKKTTVKTEDKKPDDSASTDLFNIKVDDGSSF
jgi:multidrug efflux pump subunit AcrA (membrane-fusion protein)